MGKHNGDQGGRPKYEIDYKTLDSLCAIMCTGEEIASILDVDYDTINRRLKEEGHGGFTDYYKKKSSNGRASLRRTQYKVATDGNPTMLIWMGKQHLEQTDKQSTKIEHSGKLGLVDLTDAELKAKLDELENEE